MRLLPIILILLSGQYMLAQGPPVFTDTPVMLGLDGRGLRTFGQYTSTEGVDTYLHVFAVPYNVARTTQIGAIVPFLWKRSDQASNNGLGDVTIFAKHQLVQRDGQGRTFRVLVKLAHQFTTSQEFEALPLGPGKARTSAGLVLGHISTNLGIYGEAGYRIGHNQLANRIYYNIGASLPLLPQVYPPRQINLSVELTGDKPADAKNNMSIAPAVQWITGRKVLFESGIALPLTKTAAMIPKTHYSWLFGMRILLF